MPRGELISGRPVLGPFESWRELPPDVAFLAPLHKAKAMRERLRIVEGLEIPEPRWATIIDPRSAVASDAIIGRGSFIGPFASVGPAARLAPTAWFAPARMSRTIVCSRFRLRWIQCRRVRIRGRRLGAYIAPNATIRDRCHVGSFAVVGLGAVVTKDVPDLATVVGSPVRARDA